MFTLTRRLLLGALAGTSLYPGWSSAAAHARNRAAKAAHLLRYTRPASGWDEALPIGNGRMGAMVFGRIAQERLQLNEDTLWSGAPYTPDNPDARAALPEVRKLIAANRFKEAADLVSSKVMAKPLQQMAYGSLGDVLLNFTGAVVPIEYQRSLDLTRAIATTRYKTPAGEFTREAFVSAPGQVMVLHLEARKGRLNFELNYRAPRKVRYTAPDYPGLATQPAAEVIDWLMAESPGAAIPEMKIIADEPACLLITGRNEAGPQTPAGLTFALRMKILGDGRADANDERIVVRDARHATLLIAAATSFVSHSDVSADPVAKVRERIDRVARRTYKSLVREHVREYRSLYDTASVSLPANVSSDRATNLRIAAAETSDDPALAALYFHYGRYLLISCSRPGCQPANLQGIWNEGVNPPWGSKYTININTEMNYWLADPAGLGVCIEPLLRMVEDLAVTGAKTADTMYGARGWVAHHNTDLWRATAPIDGPLWGLWPCGGAWLCNTLWDHYDHDHDRDLLARIYPLLRGAALFFLDTLIEDPQGRGLITSPSLSPENVHPFGAALCAGPAMDRQIVRDLLAHTAAAAKELNLDASLVAQLDETAERIAPDAIGRSGQLQEWLEDWDDAAPDPHHRHVSHLYAVYPGSAINVRDTPALIEAAQVSLRKRGDFATGWGTAWRLCLWARMGQGEHAHAILKSLLGPRRTYPNMFDAHPPFQIDGNFGGATGIIEMLLQSWGGEIHLLPALPDAWSSGEIRGIKARGAVTVSMRWRDRKVRWVELVGAPRQVVRLRDGATVRTIELDARGRHSHESGT